MKGLPLGLPETTSGFWRRSTGRDERATSYYAYVIMPPVISQKCSIVTKICRIVTKVCREKGVWQPKSGKMWFDRIRGGSAPHNMALNA